jgi:hypothetical protein
MKFEELSDVQKRMVYQWAYEGLTAGLANAVRAQSYYLFVLDAMGKATFDGETLWQRLNVKQSEHFAHVDKYMKYLKDEITRLSSRIADTERIEDE